jgi:hypothetical protein
LTQCLQNEFDCQMGGKDRNCSIWVSQLQYLGSKCGQGHAPQISAFLSEFKVTSAGEQYGWSGVGSWSTESLTQGGMSPLSKLELSLQSPEVLIYSSSSKVHCWSPPRPMSSSQEMWKNWDWSGREKRLMQYSSPEHAPPRLLAPQRHGEYLVISKLLDALGADLWMELSPRKCPVSQTACQYLVNMVTQKPGPFVSSWGNSERPSLLSSFL